MSVNDPSRMLMVLSVAAKTILGANNLAFMHGPEHKAIRKSFVSLFTRRALSTYTQLQVGLPGGGAGGRSCSAGARERRHTSSQSVSHAFLRCGSNAAQPETQKWCGGG